MKRVLLTMTEHALRLVALRWFLVGFSLTGKGFTGENFDVIGNRACRSLVTAHFDRIWKQERAAKREGRPIPTTYRRTA